MSFRLRTILYVFALLAAALATFGAWGGGAAILVLGFWFLRSNAHVSPFTLSDALFVGAVLVAFYALVIPALPSARNAARRNVCLSNAKQIILAFLNYELANGSQPPAYVADENGKPIHSWRVLILPFLGPNELSLYRRYNFNEPWNGPNNSKLAVQIPDVYRCPSHVDAKGAGAAETSYLAVVDSKTGWPGPVGRRVTDFPDGTSKTIMVVEASDIGVNWMEPRDLSLNEALDLMTTKKNSGHRHIDDGFLTTTYHGNSSRSVAYCDGHTDYLGEFKYAKIPKALLTVAGGESIPKELGDEPGQSEATTIIKWRKVYALSLFIILAILPATWGGRRRRNSDADERLPLPATC